MMFALIAAQSAVAGSLRFDPVDADPLVARCEVSARTGAVTYRLRIDDPSQLAALQALAGGIDEQRRPQIHLDARRWQRTDGGSVWSRPVGGQVSVRDSAGRSYDADLLPLPTSTVHFGGRTVAREALTAAPLGAWARATWNEPVEWLELSVAVDGEAAVDCSQGDATAGVAVSRVRLRY